MKLQNRTSLPKHSTFVNKTLNPGEVSRDIPCLTEYFNKLKTKTTGFAWVLSNAEKDLILSLVENYVITDPSEEKKYYDELHTDDPTGIRAIMASEREAKIKKQKELDEALAKRREEEARINSESNFLDESGNPIADKSTVSLALKEKVSPVLHKEFSTDVKSIMENNLAVLAKSPLDDEDAMDQYATTGSTDVSHDPYSYEKSK